MSNRTGFCAFMAVEEEAERLCRLENAACQKARNNFDMYAIIDGPDGGFAVVDLSTAIDMGNGYRIAS